ncbi:glycosyltransferase [Rhodobacterales bacterium HKCCE3408]|nr:glycosyltransferase [Rhodobacterales bacterium HKCCE3408]
MGRFPPIPATICPSDRGSFDPDCLQAQNPPRLRLWGLLAIGRKAVADQPEGGRHVVTALVVDRSPVPLIVIPSLDEAAHIRRIVEQMSDAVGRHGGSVVVADGGSTDGTRAIVAEIAARDERVRLLHNPRRCQAAGINQAVDVHGSGHTHLIRVDAHSLYPDDFVDVLLAEAAATGAASVVVGMVALGEALLQRLCALTQNARIGNGGSRHRRRGDGAYVDHGHHALMDLTAFRAVGGYDPDFTHNEDAELDHRLQAAGYRIWLTGRTVIGYLPRTSLTGLARQYFNFGRGRARNFLKHRSRPRLRQVAVIAVLPILGASYLAPVHPAFALPAILWAGVVALGGAALALSSRSPLALLSGPLAVLMHTCWSLGFWSCVLRPPRPVPQPEAA